MKDVLGNDIQEGDVLYKTNTNHICIALGTQTPTGKIRLISSDKEKDSADSYNLILISKEQVIIPLENLLRTHLATLETITDKGSYFARIEQRSIDSILKIQKIIEEQNLLLI